MKFKSKKKIGRIALGMFFLLNPNINVVDLIPDFIGCALIISGLSALRDVSDSLDEARRNFLRLFWISLSHIPAFVVMIMISSMYVSEKTSILVFAFVYSVLEFVLINNAITSLIDGFVYIGERYDGDCCFYETKKNGKKTDVSSLRRATTVFLLVSKTMTVLPNLVYLFDTSLGYASINSIYYARNPIDYIGPFTAICTVPALAVGIYWYTRMRRYVKGIAADESFLERVESVLEGRVGANEPVHLYRKVTTLAFILISAFILCVDLYIDEFNIIHDVLSAFVLLGAALYIKKKFSSQKSGVCVALCGIYALLQSAMFALAVYFNTHFKFSDVGRVEESDGVYALYISLLSVCEIVFVAAFVAMILSYMKVLSSGFSLAVREGHKKEGKDVFLEAQKKRNIVSFVIGVVMGACHVIQIWSMGDMRRVSMVKNDFTSAKSTYLPALEGFWMVELVVSVIFAVYVCVSIQRTREELRDRLYII